MPWLICNSKHVLSFIFAKEKYIFILNFSLIKCNQCSKVTWQYTFELLLDICCQVQSEQKYLIYLPEGE